MQSKQNGALEFTVRPEYSLVFTLREGMELMFTKYFKSLKIAPLHFLIQRDLLLANQEALFNRSKYILM